MELKNQFEVEAPVEEVWGVLTDLERIAPCMPGAKLDEVEGDDYRGTVKVKVGPITAQYKGTASFVERDADTHRAVVRAEGRDTRGQGNASATIALTLTSKGSATTADVVTDLTVTGKVAQFGRGVMGDVSAKLLDQFVSCLHHDLLGSSDAAGDDGTDEAVDASANGSGGTAAETPASGDATGSDPAPTDAPEVPAPAPAGAATAPNTPATATPTPSGATGTSTSSGGPASSSSGPRKIESAEPEPVDLMDAAGGAVAKRAVPAVVGLALVLLILRWLRQRG